MHTNTEDVDCEVCKGDLHLWAVVSVKCPGRATCAEHASALSCPVEDMVLLYRCALLCLLRLSRRPETAVLMLV